MNSTIDSLAKLGEAGPLVVEGLIGLVALIILGYALVSIVRIAPRVSGSLDKVSTAVVESTAEMRRFGESLVAGSHAEQVRAEQRHKEVMTALAGLRTDFLSDSETDGERTQ